MGAELAWSAGEGSFQLRAAAAGWASRSIILSDERPSSHTPGLWRASCTWAARASTLDLRGIDFCSRKESVQKGRIHERERELVQMSLPGCERAPQSAASASAIGSSFEMEMEIEFEFEFELESVCGARQTLSMET